MLNLAENKQIQCHDHPRSSFMFRFKSKHKIIMSKFSHSYQIHHTYYSENKQIYLTISNAVPTYSVNAKELKFTPMFGVTFI